MRQHRPYGRDGRSKPYALTESARADHTLEEQSSGEAGGDFFRRSADRKANQKARQLSRQVYRTLSVALAGCGDEVLQNLTVVSVDPAPDAGHLLVTVSAGAAADGADPADAVGALPDVLDRLGRAAGRLRSAVARDVVRKRAPELSFRVMPRGEVTP